MEFDEESRTVSGFGTVEIVDNQGDFVSVDAITDIMDIYMRRGGILMDTHSNRHVGKIIDWKRTEKDGHPAIYLTTQLFTDYTIDDMVWDAVKKGHYTGYSFGGRGLNKEIKCSNSGCYNDIDKVEVWEWSLVPKPANRLSTIDSHSEELKKGGVFLTKALLPEVTESGELVYKQVNIDTSMMLNKADEECDDKEDKEDAELEEESDKAANPRMGYHQKDRKGEAEDIGSDPYGFDQDSKHERQATKPRSRQATSSNAKLRSVRDTYTSDNWESGEFKQPKHKVGIPHTRESDKMDDYDKEDTPVGTPSGGSDSPMNKILEKLEALEHAIIKMGGGLETDKAALNAPPQPEAGKADGATGTKVALPDADQKHAAPESADDHQMQSGSPKLNLNKSDDIAIAVQNELKKMGFNPIETPRPNASGQQFEEPTGQFDFMNKGGSDMHSSLAKMSWGEIDRMVKR